MTAACTRVAQAWNFENVACSKCERGSHSRRGQLFFFFFSLSFFLRNAACHAATYNCSLDTVLMYNSITRSTWGMTKEVRTVPFESSVSTQLVHATRHRSFCFVLIIDFTRCLCNKYSLSDANSISNSDLA